MIDRNDRQTLDRVEEIRPGDVVKLAGSEGLPLLTVDSIEDWIAECVWFEENKLRRKKIKVLMLEFVE